MNVEGSVEVDAARSEPAIDSQKRQSVGIFWDFGIEPPTCFSSISSADGMWYQKMLGCQHQMRKLRPLSALYARLHRLTGQ